MGNSLGTYWELKGNSQETCWAKHMRDNYSLIPPVDCISHVGIQRHEAVGDLSDGSALSALHVETYNQT